MPLLEACAAPCFAIEGAMANVFPPWAFALPGDKPTARTALAVAADRVTTPAAQSASAECVIMREESAVCKSIAEKGFRGASETPD
jgi:hypothetical protein